VLSGLAKDITITSNGISGRRHLLVIEAINFDAILDQNQSSVAISRFNWCFLRHRVAATSLTTYKDWHMTKVTNHNQLSDLWHETPLSLTGPAYDVHSVVSAVELISPQTRNYETRLGKITLRLLHCHTNNTHRPTDLDNKCSSCLMHLQLLAKTSASFSVVHYWEIVIDLRSCLQFSIFLCIIFRNMLQEIITASCPLGLKSHDVRNIGEC